MSEFDPMQMADAVSQVGEVYGGIRASLVSQGFTQEQAGEIVVAIIQKEAADSWKVVLGKEDA